MVDLVRRSDGKLYREGGLLIRATAASLAAYRECCCIECCACARLNSLTCVHVELTGGIVDSYDLDDFSVGDCGRWADTRNLGGGCSSQWEGAVTVLECDSSLTAAAAVKFSIDAASASTCDVGPFALQSIQCGAEFSAIFTAALDDLLGGGGGCDDCGGDENTVTATLSECS